MRKIIVAFDGLKYSKSARDYAQEMASLNAAHLVGIFLEDIVYHSYKIYDLISDGTGGIHTKVKHLDKKDQKTRAAAVADFTATCKKAGMEFTLHKDRNVAIQELLKESIYADLVIIDSSETLSHHAEDLPTYFTRELLHEVQCPVMLVPHEYKPIDKLILLFDGEPSSVHAIKMLSYTMGALKKYPVEVITVNSPRQQFHIPDNKLMKEFMLRHFPEATFTVLKGLAETEIVNYLKSQKGNPLVALGAYRRGRVSRWFRASMADILLKSFKYPLFIAHNK